MPLCNRSSFNHTLTDQISTDHYVLYWIFTVASTRGSNTQPDTIMYLSYGMISLRHTTIEQVDYFGKLNEYQKNTKNSIQTPLWCAVSMSMLASLGKCCESNEFIEINISLHVQSCLQIGRGGEIGVKLLFEFELLIWADVLRFIVL